MENDSVYVYSFMFEVTNVILFFKKYRENRNHHWKNTGENLQSYRENTGNFTFPEWKREP